MNTGIDVRLLGPLEVVGPNGTVHFEGAAQRRLVAALALRAPQAVPVAALVEAAWDGQAPDGALEDEISALRAHLPVTGGADGYALELERGCIDSRRFEALLESARAGRSDPARSAEQLAAALALWRGAALADVHAGGFAEGEIARLHELRMEAIEERIAADLARGQTQQLVGQLQTLVAEHPLRKRLRGQLILALYRSGRQADALDVMRQGRRRLLDELGLEPGPELRRLEAMILAQDPELQAEQPGGVLDAPLPALANATIGREGELAEIGALLARPEVRLVTLVGAGGVGKTRLALEASRAVGGRFPGGVAYADLGGSEGVLVTAAAAALGVVADTPPELGERVARATHGASALLVLDGVERFLGDAGQIAEVLAAVPHLTVLATSRAALRLTAEHAYRVQPLAGSNAAALFTARVAAARPDWVPDDAVVEAICARLDGLPLAIELAADRARMLPLPALLERLEQRLDLLSGGPRDLPERQRSLRATLEWSWEVLEPAQRTLLAQLSVFEGGASLDACDAVCDTGEPAEVLLAAIMDLTSLVVMEAGEDAQPRLAMLETVREFAAAQLDDLSAVEARHSAYFLGYAERAAEAAAQADRRAWLARLARERGNLRVAFERLLRAGKAEDALRIAIAFARTLPWDAHVHEVRGWLAQALEAFDAEPSPRRAAGLYWDGQLAIAQARFADAEAPLEQALTVGQDLGDVALVARVLAALGRRAVLIDSPLASGVCEAAVAIARGIGDPGLLADTMLALAGAHERAGRWDRAAETADEALTLYRTANDPYGVASALGEQGFYAMVHGRLDRSEHLLSEALELRRRLGDDRRLVEPLIGNAWLDLARGSGEVARLGFLDCLALARHVDDQFNVAEALAGLSTQAALEGSYVDAVRLAGASAAIHKRIGAPPWKSVTVIQERALDGARSSLGQDTYAALLAEGGRTSPGDAIARRGRFARAAGQSADLVG